MPSETSPPADVQRLHPISLLFGIGEAARNLLVPGLVVLFLSRGQSYEAWYMLAFVPAVAGYLVKYISYRYRFGEEEMVIREGILSRNERHIPYARIQNIDLAQNPLHRLFGVAVVRLETASGGRPEAVIRVLSMEAVDAMRARVFAERQRAAAAQSGPASAGTNAAGESTPSGELLVALGLGDLVRYGLISNRGLVVVAAAAGLLSQAGLFENRVESWVRGLADSDAVPRLAPSGNLVAWGLLGLGGFLALLVLMRVLSVLWAIFQLYGFRLTMRGDDLRTEYGLLTRVSATIPRHRVQLLAVHASRLHRWFGRASLYVETAGGGAEEDGPARGQERQWLAPLVGEGRTAGLVREVFPEIDLDGVEWLPLETRAWRRLFVRGLVVVLPISAGTFALLGPWGALPSALLLGWLVVHARRSIAAAGYALTERAVLYRSGWWGRRLGVVRYSKIQALALVRSPFDRRHRTARVSVDTAGAARGGHRVSIPYLDETRAAEIAGRLYHEAVRTEFRW